MKIEEMNALRAQYREPIIETLEATFPGLIRRVPHTNDLYIMTNAPEGHPQEVKISVGVPLWISTDKTKAFCYKDAVTKAEAEFAEKEAKKAENAKKRAERSENPVSKKVDNTAYDAKVLSFLSEHEESISVADLFNAHEWDEENKETKGKRISALSRLNKEGKVNKIDGKPSAKWTIA